MLRRIRGSAPRLELEITECRGALLGAAAVDPPVFLVETIRIIEENPFNIK